MDKILFLTATFDPGKTINISVRSVSERIEQYQGALSYYIEKKYFNKIIFSENSVEDLSCLDYLVDLAKSKAIELELLSKCGDNSNPNSTGIGETSIMKHTFERSSLIDSERQMLLKVSGRYIVKNLEPFTNSMNHDYDVMCDFRGDLSTSDARVFGLNRYFFNNFFLRHAEGIDDNKGYYFEHALARAAHDCIANGGRWKITPRVPIIDGVNGTTGKRIKTSFSKRLRHLIKVSNIKY